MTSIGFGVLVALIIGAWLAVMVLWVLSLIELVKLPDQQFQAAGTEKVTWILVVALTGFIGAIIWWLAKRRDVLDAVASLPVAPPGWYPDPGADAGGPLRWWNGSTWTGHRHP